jgi:dTDP-4-amino-4,6-dideoxygalactose transaminase
VGYNSYMTHIAATIGVAQMAHLMKIINKHWVNGKFYDEALKDIHGIKLLKRVPDTESAYWTYTFLAERRDELLRHLREQGVYASKVHLRNDLYACFGTTRREFSGVDLFSQHALSIPCGWWITEEDRSQIVSLIRQGW